MSEAEELQRCKQELVDILGFITHVLYSGHKFNPRKCKVCGEIEWRLRSKSDDRTGTGAKESTLVVPGR